MPQLQECWESGSFASTCGVPKSQILSFLAPKEANMTWKLCLALCRAVWHFHVVDAIVEWTVFIIRHHQNNLNKPFRISLSSMSLALSSLKGLLIMSCRYIRTQDDWKQRSLRLHETGPPGYAVLPFWRVTWLNRSNMYTWCRPFVLHLSLLTFRNFLNLLSFAFCAIFHDLHRSKVA